MLIKGFFFLSLIKAKHKNLVAATFKANFWTQIGVSFKRKPKTPGLCCVWSLGTLCPLKLARSLISRASGDIFINSILKVTMKFFIGVRAGSHIHCSSHMHKTLQSQRKASLSHWKRRDDLDGERILQWAWDPALSVWMAGVILNPRTEFSFRSCPTVHFVLTKCSYSYGHFRTVTPRLKLRFLTSTRPDHVALVFVFCWCTRKNSWFSNVSLAGKTLEISIEEKSAAVASLSWFNNQEPKG